MSPKPINTANTVTTTQSANLKSRSIHHLLRDIEVITVVRPMFKNCWFFVHDYEVTITITQLAQKNFEVCYA